MTARDIALLTETYNNIHSAPPGEYTLTALRITVLYNDTIQITAGHPQHVATTGIQNIPAVRLLDTNITSTGGALQHPAAIYFDVPNTGVYPGSRVYETSLDNWITIMEKQIEKYTKNLDPKTYAHAHYVFKETTDELRELSDAHWTAWSITYPKHSYHDFKKVFTIYGVQDLAHHRAARDLAAQVGDEDLLGIKDLFKNL